MPESTLEGRENQPVCIPNFKGIKLCTGGHIEFTHVTYTGSIQGEITGIEVDTKKRDGLKRIGIVIDNSKAPLNTTVWFQEQEIKSIISYTPPS
jgi:hypothetical protein